MAATLTAILLSSLMVVFAAASPAHADPTCQQGGVYVLFARGSGESFDDLHARAFQHYVMQALANEGVQSSWAELGNLDNNYSIDPYRQDEYPAVPVADWNAGNVVNGAYAQSVLTGVNELVTHLNHRYGTTSGNWVSNCNRETLVLGGYSQGAEVVGDALRSPDLSQAARDHLGYAALYGDPKFNPGALIEDRYYRMNFQSHWWWVRGDDAGYHRINSFDFDLNHGALGATNPYVSAEFKGRFGSWCAAGDFVCTLTGNLQIHSSAYDGHWIAQSADEIAYEAKLKRNQLDGGPSAFPLYLASAMPYRFVAWSPYMDFFFQTANYATPVPPTINQVKRTLAPDGSTHEVYAATNSTVTEGWWQPGGNGVHSDEVINIAQDNIVGFDKVNQPDGVTQSLYTAVPDGVWETWWNASHSPTSAKIVTGLTGVRQVIVANAYEGSQFVHRLYLLAEDGPYEVWWKDGGDGVHVYRLNNITGGVAMAAGTGPDGAYEVFVATPTWVYQLWWFPGGTVNNRTILNITQGDIRSLSMGANLSDGTQLLYTGTSTTCWQSAWQGDSGGVSTGTITVSQTNADEIEKDVYNGVHEVYQTNGGRVQENWWNDSGSGSDTLITISQNNITSFDKSDDGNYQQVYTASGNLVYETYWAAGVSPTSNVLFSVTR